MDEIARSRQDGSSPLIGAITEYLPGFSPATVLDVGANVGLSTRLFSETFPSAVIYAFEPVTETYQQLVRNTAGLPVRTFRLALGRTSGSAVMVLDRGSTGSRIVKHVKDGDKTETVNVATGDAFCAGLAIPHVSLLKIDTEGYDLNVLAGFSRMLSESAIDLLEVEVGMNPMNSKHVPLAKVMSFLEPLGYFAFHLHEVTMDLRFNGRPTLRRVNAAFLSSPMIAAHHLPGKAR